MFCSIHKSVIKLEAHQELIVFINGDYIIYDHINHDYYYEIIINNDPLRASRVRLYDVKIKEKHIIYRVKGK